MPAKKYYFVKDDPALNGRVSVMMVNYPTARKYAADMGLRRVSRFHYHLFKLKVMAADGTWQWPWK